MSSETIPEWAYAQAIEFVANLTDSLVQPEQVEPIARALQAAERRGLDKAAKVAEGLHLQETENHGDLYDGDVAAAIRSLGEKT